MYKKKHLCILLAFFILFLFGCPVQRATLKTYVEPSIDPKSVRSIAVFPMRNVRLLPDESREINRGFTQAIHVQNSKLIIVGPSESTDLLNQAGLTNKYSEFLRDYATSGIPNASVLHQIGDALKVDAIVQGEVFDIYQQDGIYGVQKGLTSLTVRYVMLSTNKGDILWEATSNAKLATATTVEDAPPLYEVITIAQDKILTALPTLGQ